MRRYLLICSIFILVLTNIGYTQDNFRTIGPNARAYDAIAEKAYQDLSIYWTGHDALEFRVPVPLSVKYENHRGGGATNFIVPFDGRGTVTGFRIEVSGTSEAIAQDVIPHEITHVILHRETNGILPLIWNEGAAQISESEATHRRNRMWVSDQVISLNRWVPFSNLVDNKNWKGDIFPRQVESYSATEFLVSLKGPLKLTSFLKDSGTENQKLKKHYGFNSLYEMESYWHRWFLNHAKKGYDCQSFNCHIHSNAKPTIRVAKHTLYVLMADYCGICQDFKRDVNKRRFDAYTVVYVKSGSKWTSLTGERNPRSVPRFYIEGSNRKPEVNYSGGAPGLLQILAGIVKGLGSLIFNPDAEEPNSSPFTNNITLDGPNEFDPAPVPKELINPELNGIKSDIANVLKDIETLKSGNAFQKIPALLSLKKDVAALKENGKLVSIKVDDAKAELETIIDVAKQDIVGVKSAISVLKDEDASKLQKAIAAAPAFKKVISDAKSLKELLGDAESPINALFLLLGGVLGSIKGYMGSKRGD